MEQQNETEDFTQRCASDRLRRQRVALRGLPVRSRAAALLLPDQTGRSDRSLRGPKLVSLVGPKVKLL